MSNKLIWCDECNTHHSESLIRERVCHHKEEPVIEEPEIPKENKKKGGIKNIIRRFFFPLFFVLSIIAYFVVLLTFPLWWVIKGDNFDEFVDKRNDFFVKLHAKYWGE